MKLHPGGREVSTLCHFLPSFPDRENDRLGGAWTYCGQKHIHILILGSLNIIIFGKKVVAEVTKNSEIIYEEFLCCYKDPCGRGAKEHESLKGESRLHKGGGREESCSHKLKECQGR